MRADGAPGGRLLLVLSTERSGSTLLSAMLGGHSRILAPPELHVLRYADFEGWRRGYPAAFQSLRALLEMLGEPSDAAEVEARFSGRSSEDIYRELLALAVPGSWVVDKTPANARRFAALDRAERFRPHYVWLVRHPLGVAHSRIERLEARRRSEPGVAARAKYPLYRLRQAWRHRSGRELREQLERWRDVHGRIESFLAGIDPMRRIRIHFEDLVRAPEPETRGLCDWLGLAYEPGMLEPGAHTPSSLRWGIGDQKVLDHATIDASVASRWRESFSDDALDEATSTLMRRIGVRGEAPQG